MEKAIFIGYPAGYKGWKFYNPSTKKALISERAIFDERYFPGLKNWSNIPSFRSHPSVSPSAPSKSSLPDADSFHHSVDHSMLSNLVLGWRGMKLLNPSLLNQISLRNIHRSLKLLPLVLSRRNQLPQQLAAPVHLLLLP